MLITVGGKAEQSAQFVPAPAGIRLMKYASFEVAGSGSIAATTTATVLLREGR